MFCRFFVFCRVLLSFVVSEWLYCFGAVLLCSLVFFLCCVPSFFCCVLLCSKAYLGVLFFRLLMYFCTILCTAFSAVLCYVTKTLYSVQLIRFVFSPI